MGLISLNKQMLRRVAKKAFSKESKRTGNFLKRFIRANEEEYKQVQKHNRQELRKRHYQGKVQRMLMWPLTAGMQRKEDSADDEFFQLVFASEMHAFQKLSAAATISRESDIFQKIQSSLSWEELKKFKEKVQRKAKSEDKRQLKDKLVHHLATYNESLQALVEGQRQVMHDPQFVFEDGQTAEQKVADFRSKVGKTLESATFPLSEKRIKSQEDQLN